MNTNWTTPKRNFLAGLNDLRKALASGSNARLVRAWNQDCAHAIKTKNNNEDFRCYEGYIGYASTREKIQADPNLSDFQKHLSLNYIQVFGTEEAMLNYYENDILSADNFKSMGRAHLVKATDYIQYLRDTTNNRQRINMYERQYVVEQFTGSHLFNFFRLKKEHSLWNVSTFKRKVWVVELLGTDEPKARVPFLVKVLNVLAYPLKYTPKKSVLVMKEYKNVSYRIGGVTNGFCVEFQIPKKFSFN